MPPLKLSHLSGSDDLMPMSQAAKLTPYSAEYLSLLARKGTLGAVKIGRDWLTSRRAIVMYLKRQQQKHQKVLKGLAAAQAHIS